METEEEIISVLEFMKDATWLERKIDERKREIKNEHKIKSIARDVLQALKVIHKKNIIHADLKIQNILVEKQKGRMPVVKLADFGIS